MSQEQQVPEQKTAQTNEVAPEVLHRPTNPSAIKFSEPPLPKSTFIIWIVAIGLLAMCI